MAITRAGKPEPARGFLVLTCEVRRDLGEAPDVFGAIIAGEAQIAVEAGAQGIAVKQDRRSAARRPARARGRR